MRRLWMYFPENDLALASGTRAYTPPPAAVALHKAGEALPLWMAAPGDRFVCSGISAAWLCDVCRRFNIKDVDVYDHRSAGLEPAPWGWSEACCRAFEDAGYPAALLPGADALRRLRLLSHRRTASALAARLRGELPFDIAPPAAEAHSREEVEEFLAANGCADVIAKAPWSSSGRGLVRSRCMPLEGFLTQTAGIVRRQGSVMLEREYDKMLDFAMLFEADGLGAVAFRGLSLFGTSARGAYTSNVIAPQAVIRRRVAALAGDARFDSTADALCRVLPGLLGDYRGPLGVDMLLTADGLLDAAVELNLRYTMGFVAMALAPRLAAGAEGRLDVVPRPAASAPGVETDSCGLIVRGSLDLTPPNPDFAFRLTVGG